MSLPNELLPVGLLATGAAGGYEIERSLRFNSADSAYLSRTPASAGNRKTWTWAGWVKRSALSDGLFEAGTTNNITAARFFSSVLVIQHYDDPVFNWTWTTSAVFRDFSAWYHIVFTFDTTQASSSDAAKIYVNGVQQALTFALNGAGAYSQNTDSFVSSTSQHRINTLNVTSYGNMYLADVHFIDGQALDPTSFGEFDENGIWQPVEYTGEYGTNGFHLPFSDNSSASALGTDTSGNGNDWTVNNLSVTAGAGNDSLIDVPINGTQTDTGLGGEVRGNYCTLNPLQSNATGPLANGNLEWGGTFPGNFQSSVATIGMSSGKWYAEFTRSGGSSDITCGIAKLTNSQELTVTSYFVGGTATSYGYYSSTGDKFNNGSGSSYGAAYADGDTIGVAFDADSGTLTFYKNGVSQGTAFTGLTGTFAFACSVYQTTKWIANFGQRPFAYQAPEGFKSLNTANLPTPTILDGSDYMDVVTYTGNGSTQTISGLEFSPDLVWVKSRSNAISHFLYDQVRGFSNGNAYELRSNSTNAEAVPASASVGLTSFNSDGFSLGSDAGANTNAATYVSWTWDAGSSTVENTDGTITSQVRASPTSGCSIVTYSGNGTDGATIGHGLNVAPQMVIIKRRNAVDNWPVYHTSLGGGNNLLFLETADAKRSDLNVWSSTAPSSSVITIGDRDEVNNNTSTYVAYCFAPVDSYSRFGSYTGNGSTDGPFVWTGFAPKYLLVKSSTVVGGQWFIWDTTRSTYNAIGAYLQAQSSTTEANTVAYDFCANGFKLRGSGVGINGSGSTYIYAAFAENPFSVARAR